MFLLLLLFLFLRTIVLGILSGYHLCSRCEYKILSGICIRFLFKCMKHLFVMWGPFIGSELNSRQVCVSDFQLGETCAGCVGAQTRIIQLSKPCLKNKLVQPGVVAHAFRTWEAEFEASLVCRVSSKIGRATQRNPASKNENINKLAHLWEPVQVSYCE